VPEVAQRGVRVSARRSTSRWSSTIVSWRGADQTSHTACADARWDAVGRRSRSWSTPR